VKVLKVDWIRKGQSGPFSDSVFEARVTFDQKVTDEEAFDLISKSYFRGKLRKPETMLNPFEAKLEHWSGNMSFTEVYFRARRMYCD
jgi:hypothetical protein